MTLVIAHRGASAYAPENTMPAFELAVRQGADMLELDVQRTADGVLVVFHDDTTERWDGRKRLMTACTLAELQALDAQRARLQASGQLLAAERVNLALAGYQAGRGELSAVLAARREAVETGLRLIDLDMQRAALGVRLTTLVSEQ